MRHSEAKRRRKARTMLQQLRKARNVFWKAECASMPDAERLAMQERLSLLRIWQDCVKGGNSS